MGNSKNKARSQTRNRAQKTKVVWLWLSLGPVPDSIHTLGELVRWAREQRGLSCRALAEKIGVSAPFLSDLEHDRRSTSRLEALAEALGLPLAELQLRDGRMPDVTAFLKTRPELVKLIRQIKAGRLPPLILDACSRTDEGRRQLGEIFGMGKKEDAVR
jgi:transcriptional regulator with XRE-family HTH domain